MLKRALVLSTLAGLCWAATGCGFAYTAKSNELLKTAPVEDYGPPPPENHQEAEKAFIEGMLKDPESARYQFEEPIRGTVPSSTWSTTPRLVWVCNVRVNAKNSMGGYVGFQLWRVAWRDGRIIAYSSGILENIKSSVGAIWTLVK